jgi:Tfp pilus assembly protein FimT
MSTSMESQPRRERSWIYYTALILLIAMVVAALIVFRGAKESREASDKADQLITALEEAGARAPDKDQVVSVLGDDGGATCENPNDALSRSVLLSQLTNGASGPGARPVIADSRVFKGQLLIIEVYCPDELDEFRAFVDDLETADVAGD